MKNNNSCISINYFLPTTPAVDPVPGNDTLTKTIYGKGDIAMHFITTFVDTIYKTGPFEITAEIFSFSGAGLGQVKLYVTTTTAGVSKDDTLPMVNTSGNLWTGNIPQREFESNVHYAIKLEDNLTNQIEIKDSFYIKRYYGGFTGEKIIGTGTVNNYYTPIAMTYAAYSWTRQLYLGTELSIDPQIDPKIITITKLAWEYADTSKYIHANQQCYFQAVDEAVITANAYINPVAGGATEVWRGDLQINGQGWVEITLAQPFILPQGKNLLIHWHNQSGTQRNYPIPYPYWRHTTTPFNSTIYAYSTASFTGATTANRTLNAIRPNARFYIEERITDNNSVAIVSVNSPVDGKGVLANGSPVPVQINIKNKGTNDLQSCIINWSVNGTLQTGTPAYNGTLAEDFTDTITIGSYIPTVGGWDVIKVWVSMPNNANDPVLLDDTLEISVLGCATILSNIIRIGGSSADYNTIGEALQIIRDCGTNGDITLELTGTFTENISLAEFANYLGGYSLTITSADNDPEHAIIKPNSGVGIVLNNTRNLIIKNITIDVTEANRTHGIQFTGACSNIVIRECVIKSDTTTNQTRHLIYKATGTGIVNNISFIKNQLEGGNNGIDFAGGAGNGIDQYGTNVVIDSNTIKKIYSAGIYSQYVNLTSCSYNTIETRTTGSLYYFYGARLSYVNGTIVGNRIIQRFTSIQYPYGIYVQNYNSYPTGQVQGRGFIANNEIILSTTSTYAGIYAQAAKADIIHNSIYVCGTGAARGIYITNSANNDMVIKNNNIVINTTASSNHPIYFSATSNMHLYDIDYNNLYGRYTGYYGGDISTLADWQQTTSFDKHSVRISPDFIDTDNGLKNNLKFTDKGGQVLCNSISSVDKDIDGTTRASQTTMGCYQIPLKNANAMLVEITDLREGGVLAQTDSVKVIIRNIGSTYLSSINVEWSVAGTSRLAGGTLYSFSPSLSTGESATITLGEITYTPAGKMDIKVWINRLNNNVNDNYSGDDTLERSINICATTYGGTITVGPKPTNDFPTIEQAFDALNVCGLHDDLIMALEPGTYGSLNLSNTASFLSAHTLTITSVHNNADSIIFRPASGSGILLNNTSNLVLKAITVNVSTSGTHAIEFTGATPFTNITVRDCKLLANPTGSSYNPVNKAYGSGTATNVSFINNLLDGGYYGIQFYGSDNTLRYGTNIVFDSNTVTNSAYSGVYLYLVDFTSCSYNKVLSRTGGTGSWYAFSVYNSSGTFIGNSIIQRSTSITSPYGIYAQNYSNAFIANNEFILNIPSAGTAAGIYVQQMSRPEIVHNSIYITGAGAKGIYIGNSNTELQIKNNNIVLPETGTYPVYFAAASANPLFYYNNLYSPTNIGYYNANPVTNLSDWQTAFSTSFGQVSVLPHFLKTDSCLALIVHNDTLLCPKEDNVQTDIKRINRPNVTHIGAYALTTTGLDLMLDQVSPWSEEVINNQTIPIHLDLMNTGTITVSNAVLGWRLNGGGDSTTSLTGLSLMPYESVNVPLGTFLVTDDTINLVVWIESVNRQKDPVTWNDTVFVTAIRRPLVEFVAPFPADTNRLLNFDVNAKVLTVTGALTPPILLLETILNGSSFYDSIPMLLDSNTNIWQAMPQPYYGSTVIYSITVSDTLGNTNTAKDTIYIPPIALEEIDSVIIGTEIAGYPNNSRSPASMSNNYSWSRQLYLYSEVCPDMSPLGTYITKIAWQSLTANATYTNQTCYMFATDKTIQTTGYLDPVSNGFSKVWAGTLHIMPGWVEIALDTPFFLPFNKNLEIGWHHEHGSYNNAAHTWAHSYTSYYRTSFADDATAFPITKTGTQTERPNIKIIKEFPFQLYSGNNLGLMSFLSPVANFDNLCAVDYEPVEVSLGNLGENDYDFAIDTVSIYYEIIDPLQTKYTGYKTLYAGKLAPRKTTTVELLPALPVMYPGKYELKVWLSSTDNKPYDDTLVYYYLSGKFGLPISENFSGNVFPDEFDSKDVNIPGAKWEMVTQGTGSDVDVQPIYGSGMLAFTGERGATTHLLTRQLDLIGTTLPTLTFWYFHDTIASDDYTDVRISTNGGATYTTLLSVLKQDSAYGWKDYSADLTPYIGGQCIQILFEAMRLSPGTGSQYIDRIFINSQSDLAISKMTLPLQTACDIKNAELEVILSTVTNQIIDLSDFSASLAVEIPNYQSLSPILLHKRMEGLSSDTIRIPVPNLSAGSYTIKAYLTSPVDNLPNNDTAYYVVNINPKLTVTVNSITDGKNCFKKGIEVYQGVVLQNTGNLDLSGIELSLLVVGDNSTEMVKETKTVDLHVGDSILYPFENAYTAPSEATYQVQVFVWLGCDSVLVNNRGINYECVDLDNISIVSIDNPVDGQTSIAGSTDNIIVTIANESDNKRYTNVTTTALIEDKNGRILNSRMEVIPVLEADSIYQITFMEAYTVPNDSIYYIRVYLSNEDIYTEDDTAKIECYTESVSIKATGLTNAFTLYQNIPNPATNSTRIDYSVPEAGEVIFHVHSISGQLLYSQTIDTKRGANSIELNTTTFAAGVYFYSMEYKGQRLVRQLIISN